VREGTTRECASELLIDMRVDVEEFIWFRAGTSSSVLEEEIREDDVVVKGGYDGVLSAYFERGITDGDVFGGEVDGLVADI
jgi:hypothetical protein